MLKSVSASEERRRSYIKRCFFNVVFVCFKMSPYLLKLFLRMLQLSFAVYIQKCFVDYN